MRKSTGRVTLKTLPIILILILVVDLVGDLDVNCVKTLRLLVLFLVMLLVKHTKSGSQWIVLPPMLFIWLNVGLVASNMSVKRKMTLANVCVTTDLLSSIILNILINLCLLILAATKMVSLWRLLNASSPNLSFAVCTERGSGLICYRLISLAASIFRLVNCVRAVFFFFRHNDVFSIFLLL